MGQTDSVPLLRNCKSAELAPRTDTRPIPKLAATGIAIVKSKAKFVGDSLSCIPPPLPRFEFARTYRTP